MDMGWGWIIFIILFAFLCEYLDSTLGMGYGTIMSPVLLILGFKPSGVVFAILVSELLSGILAGLSHHQQGNVNFKINSKSVSQDFARERVSWDLKIVIALLATSIIGALIAGILARYILQVWVRLYIGVVVVLMGMIILFCVKRDFKFSWIRIISLGLLASFNKGLTGGGYGPLIVSGQIISGVTSKRAVGITSLAEGLTCLVGVLTYIIILRSSLDVSLVPYVGLGAVCAVGFASRTVKKISTQKLKVIIGIATIILGTFTIIRTIFK